MEDDLPGGIGEERQQRPEPDGEHVDRIIRLGRRDLHQADLFRVRVEAVRLRIERDARLRRDRFGGSTERRRVGDEKLLAFHRASVYHRARFRGERIHFHSTRPRAAMSARMGRNRPRASSSRRLCARPVAAR